MWPRLDQKTSVIVQGMTGKEGSRMASWMIQDGMNVVAGVSPGKGGTEVEGRPIFHSVKEACASHAGIAATCIVVPAPFVLSAVREAIEARIPLIHIFSERVPVHDVMEMRAAALKVGLIILGPSSVGYLQFPHFRLGYLGGRLRRDWLSHLAANLPRPFSKRSASCTQYRDHGTDTHRPCFHIAT